MQFKILPGTDMNVSRVCLGTMTWGEQNTEAEAHQQLDYAIGQGINFIDTAEMYPVPPNARTQGRTENYLGTWLARQQRDRLFIATKVAGLAGAMTRNGRTDLSRTCRSGRPARTLQTDTSTGTRPWPQRTVPNFGATEFDPARKGRPSIHDQWQPGRDDQGGRSALTAVQRRLGGVRIPPGGAKGL